MNAPALTACPNATLRQPSCKRRACPFCGTRWARDVVHVMRENLAAFGGKVVMVTITPPGAGEGLPWDEEHCAHRRPHRHSGPRGCRVEPRRGREWNETAVDRMNALRRAATAGVRRSVGADQLKLLDRVWEPQRRGVAHWHGVFAYSTFQERRAVRAFVAYLHDQVELDEGRSLSRARFYGFGNVHPARDQVLKPLTAAEAARYLASYLTGRNAHKPTMREAMYAPAMTALTGHKIGRRSWPIWWVTPTLTRRTFVTMRILRRARHAWAWLRGRCDPPAWASAGEAVRVAVVFRRVYCKRAGPAIDSDEAIALAAAIDAAAAAKRKRIFVGGDLGHWDVPFTATTYWRAELDELVRMIVPPLDEARPAMAAAA